MAKELKDLTKRADNYSQWYNDLVVKADLAEQLPPPGRLELKPKLLLKLAPSTVKLAVRPSAPAKLLPFPP